MSEYERLCRAAGRIMKVKPFYSWTGEDEGKREFTIFHSGGYCYLGEEPVGVLMIETERVGGSPGPGYRIKGIFFGKAPGKDPKKEDQDKFLSGPELIGRILAEGKKFDDLEEIKNYAKEETKKRKVIQNVG